MFLTVICFDLPHICFCVFNFSSMERISWPTLYPLSVNLDNFVFFLFPCDAGAYDRDPCGYMTHWATNYLNWLDP